MPPLPPGHLFGQDTLVSGAILSPFTQLRRLIEGIAPGHARPIELTIGEPREAMPAFVADKLAEASGQLGKYPPIRGSDALKAAISDWLGRRYRLATPVDPGREILALNGSREGLFYACVPAVGRRRFAGRPAILMCNPYYSAYIAGALSVGAEAVCLNATTRSGFLPDLDEIAADKALLERTAALFICSPANPQGAVASPDYVRRALALARQYDFVLFLDECYSEIYTHEAPVGGLEVAAGTPERFQNLVVFNSLSKRSNLPGLRSGFCAGDAAFIETFAELRNMCAPQVPGIVQHASAAAWADESHVAAARAAYSRKFDLADQILGSRLGYKRPAGGFCLWLDVSQIGGAEKATVTLWKSFGVKVIPGAYLAQCGRDGTNPGANYVRVALVETADQVGEALERIALVTA